MSHTVTSSLSLQTTDSSVSLEPESAGGTTGPGMPLVLGAAALALGAIGWLAWFGARRSRRRSRSIPKDPASKRPVRPSVRQRPEGGETAAREIIVHGTEVTSSTTGSPKGTRGGEGRSADPAPGPAAGPAAGPSSAPPLPLAVRRGGSSEPRGLGFKGHVSSDAGRYSLSSRAPGEGGSNGSSGSEPIPRAPRVPSEALPPPQDPLPPPADGPRTQRGLGIPSPPPGFGGAQGAAPSPATSHNQTVRGIGSLPVTPSSEPPRGNSFGKTVRGMGPSNPLALATRGSSAQGAAGSPGPVVHSGIPVGKETLKWGASAPLFDATGAPVGAPAPGGSSSWPGAQPNPSANRETRRSSPPNAAATSAVSVQRIRPAALPKEKLAEHLRGVGQELLDRAGAMGRVVLLTAPPREADLLVQAAVELARGAGASCPGGVALGETDFERPRIREWLGVEVPFGKGLSEQIHAAVRSGRSSPWVVLDADLGFDLLLEGRIRSPGLLWSQEFPEVVDALRQRYRLVLLVGPAHPSSVDEQALRDVCDDVLSITAEGTSDGSRAAHWRRLEDKVFRTLRLPRVR